MIGLLDFRAAEEVAETLEDAVLSIDVSQIGAFHQLGPRTILASHLVESQAKNLLDISLGDHDDTVEIRKDEVARVDQHFATFHGNVVTRDDASPPSNRLA